MANVTSVYLLPEGLTGGLNLEDKKGFTAVRIYQVEFDAPNGSIWLAVEARNPQDPVPADEVLAVPAYGLAHPDDPTSFVLAKHAEALPDAPWIWKVTVGYGFPTINPNNSSPKKPDAGGGSPPAPIPSTRCSRGTWSRQKAWDKDLDDNPVVNSAGEPFDPPPVTENQLMEWTIVRTQNSFSDLWKDYFENSINLAGFTMGDLDCAAHTLLVARISAEEVPATDRTPRYFTVTVVVRRDPAGWETQLQDRGWQKKLPVGGAYKLVPMLTVGGQKPAQPQPLDGHGQPLAPGAAPVYLPFTFYEETDFAFLALDVHN